MSLSQDLEQIRIHHNVNRDTVHNVSKLAIYIIESIENGSIFDDANNITYQRSYVRTYAKTLRIDDSDVVQALDEHYSGKYNGSLRKKYLEDAIAQTKPNFEKPIPEKNEPTEVLKVAKENKSTQDTSVETPILESKTEEKEVSPKPRKVISGIAGDITRLPELDASPYNKTKTAPNVSSVNWASVNSDKTSKTSAKLPLIIVVVCLVLAAGTYAILHFDLLNFESNKTVTTSKNEVNNRIPESTPENSESAQIEDEITPNVETIQDPKPDSLANFAPPASFEPTLNQIQTYILPDTLSILVWASNEKLEPVRVKTDLTDSYFPYWIEKGTAMRFQFTSEVTIKGQYDRMQILFNNGRPMEDFKSHRGKDREILITRALFESKIDLVQPVTEAEIKSFPQPKKIIDRPVF
jgi:cytoskeletal protein RodZ